MHCVQVVKVILVTLLSPSKRGLLHTHSYENEFDLLVNEISFSYERMGTKTRFDKEAKGNSEQLQTLKNGKRKQSNYQIMLKTYP